MCRFFILTICYANDLLFIIVKLVLYDNLSLILTIFKNNEKFI